GEARQDAVGQRFAQALLHRRDELARHIAAFHRVDELVSLAGGLRLHPQPDVAILAPPSRLLDELALDLDRLLYRLAVGNLRLADVGVDTKLALHAIDDDLEVQLAHARDDRLPRLVVGAHAKTRVFLGQAVERDTHLFLVHLGLWLDSLRNHWLREHHPL